MGLRKTYIKAICSFYLRGLFSIFIIIIYFFSILYYYYFFSIFVLYHSMIYAHIFFLLFVQIIIVSLAYKSLYVSFIYFSDHLVVLNFCLERLHHSDYTTWAIERSVNICSRESGVEESPSIDVGPSMQISQHL